MPRTLLVVFLLAFLLQNIHSFSQYSTYGSGYPSNYGKSFINKAYSPTAGYGPINSGLASNIETSKANLAAVSSNLASGLLEISPYGCETITPVAIENINAYGGSGNGEVGFSGEMPVVGTTNVGGQVPVTGSVRFSGDVPAGGIISVAATCGGGFSGT